MTASKPVNNRQQAIRELTEYAKEWGKEYSHLDFILDAALRQLFLIAEKRLGHPPYEDWINRI
jgi:hypothetical protein